MAEDFQAAVYGGSWWMPPRTANNHSSCSSDIEHMENLVPFWPKDMMDMMSKSTDESSDGGTTTTSPDSAFQAMTALFSDSEWDRNMLFRVQEGMNTFSASGDAGLKAEIEAEHQAFTVDQLQSLFDSNSPPPSQQHPLYDFQSNSNNPFSSNSASSLNHNNISSLFPSPSSDQFLQTSYKELDHQEICDLGSSAKKSPGELPFKRPRLETPSPLPTFKVRKDKLGDRITALQQLVSPFGKTDTASVLHEAIEYIKLLHDQLNILSAPYMKGATKQLQPIHDKVKDEERRIHDLRSQGLCLVPVSTTFPVATEMASGFWTPSYDGAFK